MASSDAKPTSLFHRICEHPALNLAAGFIMLLTGLLECLEPILGTMPLGAHHGVMVYGLVRFMNFLPTTLNGLRLVEQGEEHVHARASISTAATGPQPSGYETR